MNKQKLANLHDLYNSHQKPHHMLPIGVSIHWRDNRYHILVCSCGQHFGWCTKPEGMAYCYNVVQPGTELFNDLLLANMPAKYFKHAYAQAKPDKSTKVIQYYTIPEQPSWWPV